MLGKFAVGFGIVLLLVGVLGFVPGAAPNGHLLGIFHINVAHNLVHLLTGAAALLCGLTSEHASRTFFRVFGVIYGLVAILGLFSGDQPVLGIIANNMADVVLHLAIAAFSLVLGFVVRTPAAQLAAH
jgi:hypothetical protein